MSEPLLRTPLYEWHAAHGARLVPFGGWEMPVQYTSIVDEHTATRTMAGLFDISHMGRINITGPDALAFLDRLLSTDVLSLKPNQVRYSLILNERGGILDDVLIYLMRGAGHILVVNASNRLRILEWIGANLKAGDSVGVQDLTCRWGMIAVQGPRSLEIVQSLAATDVTAIKYYRFSGIYICGASVTVSRTGYTGEDGFELIGPSETVVELWEKVMRVGEPLGLRPAGLGARDTLRLEAAMPLYGHELDEQTNPLEAGLGFAVKLEKPYFIGKAALVALKDAGLKRRRVGLEVEGKRIAREGYPVLQEGSEVGRITSGTFSPTLAKSIAMAYVRADLAAPGTPLDVDIRGQAVPARVVKLPFYKRRKE